MVAFFVNASASAAVSAVISVRLVVASVMFAGLLLSMRMAGMTRLAAVSSLSPRFNHAALRYSHLLLHSTRCGYQLVMLWRLAGCFVRTCSVNVAGGA